MTDIYCLMHTYDNEAGEAEEKVLGFFETAEEAKQAIELYANLPGFLRHPEGFFVDRIELGKLNWNEGFETIVDDEAV